MCHFRIMNVIESCTFFYSFETHLSTNECEKFKVLLKILLNPSIKYMQECLLFNIYLKIIRRINWRDTLSFYLRLEIHSIYHFFLLVKNGVSTTQVNVKLIKTPENEQIYHKIMRKVISVLVRGTQE